jgi:hypothetical protein
MSMILLMVVHNLDVVRVPVHPQEADAPLIVDANAKLTGSITREPLKSVSWRLT